MMDWRPAPGLRRIGDLTPIVSVTNGGLGRYTGMLGSLVVYSGLVAAGAGMLTVIRPLLALGLGTRARGLTLAWAGLSVAVAGLLLPALPSRITTVRTRLDEFAPAWQFNEVHTIRIAAPPDRVFEAIKQVRADEILFFRTLTWIRRGGRATPPGILNAGSQASLIDVALKGGFVLLADDSPREVVLGMVVGAPAGYRPGTATPAFFTRPVPPGFALGIFNLVVTLDGPTASLVSTETRVFTSSPAARRRFAAYWRVIYPGSALIRRMWLRAIENRALGRTQT